MSADYSLKYHHIDMDGSEVSDKEVPIDYGLAFLEKYLIPAYRRMREKKSKTAVIIVDALPITFSVSHINFFVSHSKEVPTEVWSLRIGRVMTKEMADETGTKILSAFRLWGYSRAWGFWTGGERGGQRYEVHLGGIDEGSSSVGLV